MTCCPASGPASLIAVIISLAFGALLTFGPRNLTFEAQEALGGTLSIIAVGFVTWMVFWMARHARGLSGELRGKIDTAADAGGISLVVVALLAVGREGLETALFLWSATQATTTSGGSTLVPFLGAMLGILTAVAMGFAFYKGVLKINLAKFFRWTGDHPDHRRRRRARLRRARPAGGRHPARPEQPRLRRQRPDPADLGPRHVAQGHPQLLARHDLVLEAFVWVAYVVPTMTLFLLQTASARARPSPLRSAAQPAQIS